LFQNKIIISIGDGGNEVGMGNVKNKVEKFIPYGEKICANTECNYLLVCDVSNWGGLRLLQFKILGLKEIIAK